MILTKEMLENLYYDEKSCERLEGVITEGYKKIKRLENDIRRLRERADVHSPKTENVPRGGCEAKSKLDIIVPEMVDKEDELERLKQRVYNDRYALMRKKKAYREKVDKIEKEINAVRRPRVKLALQYHYIDHLTWEQTVEKMGEDKSPDSLRMACERYFAGKRNREDHRKERKEKKIKN